MTHEQRIAEIRELLGLYGLWAISSEDRRKCNQALQSLDTLAAECLRLREGLKIVVICGSSRFVQHCAVKAWELNKQGIATFFMPCLPEWYPGVREHHQAEAEGVAENLDNLWLRLIEMADEVFVMNINGYIGERTAIEIAHANKLGKPVRYEIEPVLQTTDTVCDCHMRSQHHEPQCPKEGPC